MHTAPTPTKLHLCAPKWDIAGLAGRVIFGKRPEYLSQASPTIKVPEAPGRLNLLLHRLFDRLVPLLDNLLVRVWCRAFEIFAHHTTAAPTVNGTVRSYPLARPRRPVILSATLLLDLLLLLLTLLLLGALLEKFLKGVDEYDNILDESSSAHTLSSMSGGGFENAYLIPDATFAAYPSPNTNDLFNMQSMQNMQYIDIPSQQTIDSSMSLSQNSFDPFTFTQNDQMAFENSSISIPQAFDDHLISLEPVYSSYQ